MFAPKIIMYRETGTAVPSRVSLPISILRPNLVLPYGIPPDFRGGGVGLLYRFDARDDIARYLLYSCYTPQHVPEELDDAAWSPFERSLPRKMKSGRKIIHQLKKGTGSNFRIFDWSCRTQV